MPRRRGAPFLPLDVRFMDDDRIIAAGEEAGWLYLAICCKAKALERDGVLTVRQVEQLAIKRWQKRLDALVREGAVECAGDEVRIVAWLHHNDPSEVVRSRRDKDAQRKTPARNPNGKGPESAPASNGIRPIDVEVEVKEPHTPLRGACSKHDQTHPNCRGCGTNPRAEARRHDAVADLQRCPAHPAERASSCRSCAADRLAGESA